MIRNDREKKRVGRQKRMVKGKKKERERGRREVKLQDTEVGETEKGNEGKESPAFLPSILPLLLALSFLISFVPISFLRLWCVHLFLYYTVSLSLSLSLLLTRWL